jgi:UDP-GlcNAc:undecaprenyl-phosphate GlcNAc-1-phosphate transferase
VQQLSLGVLVPWLWALVGPWLLALVLTPLVARAARHYGALDLPQGRKSHDAPVPLLGGVAVFGAAALALAIGAQFSPPIRGGLLGAGSLSALGIGTLAMVALGTWDDLRDLSAGQKLAGQLAIAALTWGLGFRCGEVELAGGWVISDAAPISFAITVAWIITVTNAFNLIDGIDGLTAGIGIAAALVIFTLASHHGATVAVVAALSLSGALAGFLRFNLPPARIFLGDGGALAIGYVTAVTSLASAQKGPTAVVLILPFLALGVPLVDTITAVLRRLRGHVRSQGRAALHPLAIVRAVITADRGHVHHLLLRSGWSVRRVLFVLYALSALLGWVALELRAAAPGTRWAVCLGLIAVGIAGIRWMEGRVERLEAAPAERRRAAP